jgi:hypothetical protein
VLPRKSFKKAKVCLSSSIIPKKVPNSEYQILFRGLPKHGFQMVPKTPSNPCSSIPDCSQESYDERDQSLCVPSIFVPNVPNDKPNTKSSKVVHFFMFTSGSAFFGARFCIFFNDVNNMISTHTKDFCVKILALICQISENFLYRHISTTGSNT